MEEEKTGPPSRQPAAPKNGIRPKRASGETETPLQPIEDVGEPTPSSLAGLDQGALRAIIGPIVENVVERLCLTVTQETSHVGPWPSPETMAGYAEITPEFPQVIVDDYREYGRHAREINKSEIKANIWATFVGMAAGFILALVGLTGAIIVGLYGAWPVGVALGGGTLVGLAGVFVYGSRKASGRGRDRDALERLKIETKED